MSQKPQNPGLFPIVVNHKTREISVGEWKTNRIYYNSPLKENDTSLKNIILDANGVSLTIDYKDDTGKAIKNYHTSCAAYLGPMFYKRLRAITIQTWIDPVREMANAYCFYCIGGFNHYYDKSQLKRLWKHKMLVVTAQNDGLANIIPFIIYFGRNPAFLKKALGKGIWKKLCGNSKHHNKMLVKTIQNHFQDSHRICTVRNFERYKSLLSSLATLRSSLVSNMQIRSLRIHCADKKPWILNSETQSLLQWINRYCKVSCINDLQKSCNLVRDTKSMAKQLNVPFKFWSLTRMNIMHDSFSKLILAKSFSKKTISWTQLISLPIQPTGDGVSIKILPSPFEIAAEGNEMMHCIASYIGRVKRKQYLVISLADNKTDARSTLGLYAESDGRLVIHQHYGSYNNKVINRHLIQAAKHLNKKLSVPV